MKGLFRVVLGGQVADWRDILSGVSQGSVLSPVHTSDNVAKNGDNVAETGDIVVKATTLSPKPATLSPKAATLSLKPATLSPKTATISKGLWTKSPQKLKKCTSLFRP